MTVTTGQERREHERKTITSAIKGEFQITIEGKSYPVLNVKDVSISGIGLTFMQEIATNTEIRLCFNAADLKLAISGRVAWCTENKSSASDSDASDTFQLGIEFDASNKDHNCLLFMALRKYLDDFD